MGSIALNNHEYISVKKLDVFAQLAVARKLYNAIPYIEGLVSPENANKDKKIIFLLILAQLNDQDSSFVVNTCLSVISRVQPEANRPAPIVTSQGGIMFDDITLPDLLELSAMVIEENVGDFFHTTLSGLAAQTR